jgi:signal transduction histidine kinase
MKTETIKNRSVFPGRYPEQIVQPVALSSNFFTQHNVKYVPSSVERPLLEVGGTQGIVHEMRNPLTNINLSLAHLKSEISDPDLGHYLDIIERSAGRINELVTALLKSSEKEIWEVLSIETLINEALELSADTRALRTVEIILSFGQEQCFLHVHRWKITMAISNIIINAIEAVADNSGKIHLKIEKCGSKCMLIISDNGCGIHPNHLHKIFSPHFTLKASGTGIGLAVARETLTDHHAEIDVKSEPGKGTRFTITLPLEHNC